MNIIGPHLSIIVFMWEGVALFGGIIIWRTHINFFHYSGGALIVRTGNHVRA